MAYEVELDGTLFQANYFSVDNESLIFKDTQMMCADITGFAYGAHIIRVHGIKANTEYRFRFIDSSNDVIAINFYNPHLMDLKAEDVNEQMVYAIWEAFGNRLYTEVVATIASGKIFRLGTTQFSGKGITLVHKPFLGKAREVLVPWREIDATVESGYLILRDGREPRISASHSLDSEYNAHIVNQIFLKIADDPTFVDVLTGK